MIDDRELFERAAERFDPPRDAFDRFSRRQHRRRRNKRIGAAIVAIAVAALLFGGIARAIVTADQEQPVTPPNTDIFEPIHGWIVAGSNGGIVAIDPDDPSQRIRLSDEPGMPVAWSRDGEQLLLKESPLGPLWVLGRDGRRIDVPHTQGTEAGWFTPDGSEVAFVDGRGVQAVDIATGSEHTLVGGSVGRSISLPLNTGGQLSPDGTELAYGKIPGPWNLSVLNLGDSTSRQLVDQKTAGQLQGSPDYQGIIPAAWSPDGTRLAFSTEGKTYSIVAVINADGTGLRRLTPQDMSFAAPSWSPDGRQIAVTNREGTLRIMDADGTNIRDVHVVGQALWNPVPGPSSS